MPYLKRLSEALGTGAGRVVGVSQDPGRETRALVDSYQVGFPVLLDTELEVSLALDPPSVPALFLVGADGKIHRSSVGFEKAEINGVAEVMLTESGLPTRIIAEQDDGVPDVKPGCSSRHLEPRGEASKGAAPEPVDLMPETGARASRIEVPDDVDAYEYCMSAGYSAFLPVVPPTVERVDEFLDEVPLPPDHVLGLVPPCYGVATVEKVCANAVMAGCKPEYMEVLFPMVRAARKQHGWPRAAARDDESRWRASGRDRHGDAREPGPILVLHRRESRGESVGAAARRSGSGCRRQRRDTLCRCGSQRGERAHGPHRSGRAPDDRGHARDGLVLCPEHAATLAADGFTKDGVREFLFDNTGVPLRGYEHEGTEGTQLRQSYEKILIDGEPHYRKFADPSQILVVVAGGTAGKFSGVIGGWLSGPRGSQTVTYPVRW